MITILATIFVFGLIVLVHEWGHFITAKLSGMIVEEFAIGFGPAIFKKKVGETLYSLRAIPLGGYNKIAGMDPEEDCGDRGFSKQSVWKRLIVIAAGASMNFVLAIVIFFGMMATVGTSTVTTEAIVGQIDNNSPAAYAHLEVGDRILSINGKSIADWKDIRQALVNEGENSIPITVERDGKVEELSIIPKTLEKDQAVIGIYPMVYHEKMTIGQAFVGAFEKTWAILVSMIVMLKMIVTGAAAGSVAGPVGIAQMAGQVASHGFLPLLNLTAVLSINLGLINLLPIPVLDGGHIVVLLIEGITGRKLPEKALQSIQMVGLAILAFIFLYATFNDITRLF